MSEERKLESAADVERAASQAAREPKPKQKPVYVYLIAMFAVALLLMSLSFFMSHRSNQEVMGELQQNVNSFQLLQESEERNAALMEEIAALEEEVDAQRDTIFDLQQEILSLQKQLVEARQQIPAVETEQAE
ncbi:MAG: hypothetical protein IKL23_00430 [Oscillospiraceae bacterium]|nr:hypothetical protein [Oscillospiraceae bacterium]